mmetsp:Transcript_33284/g.37342  ORF Transcript_33284/g.37342 Transcript_33284/m.37342 type:complete len:81 (-) Transcript_33284:527-769(-)
MTKVPPAVPMKRRTTASPVAELTRPVHAVGIAAKHKTTAMGIRAPNLSQAGPNAKLIKIVPATPTIEDVQISCFVNPKVS